MPSEHESEKSPLVVVSESVLPEIILKVLRAKELKAASKDLSSSEVCRIIGLSRSAYYKYKDCVFRYEEQSENNVFSLSLLLKDRQGVLSAVISKLYELGLNIVKINQETPVDAVASVSIMARCEAGSVTVRSDIKKMLEGIDGVIGVKFLTNL